MTDGKYLGLVGQSGPAGSIETLASPLGSATPAQVKRLLLDDLALIDRVGHLALIAAFPRIFRDRSSALAALNHPLGWHKLMRALLEQVNALLDDRQVEGFGLLLTKSKFAGLHLHWMFVVPEGASDATLALWERYAEQDEQARALIGQAVGCACDQSEQTCEWCGAMGTVTSIDGFLVTLCTPCEVRAEFEALW